MSVQRERFLKVAEQRTNKIILTLKLLSNCSNKSNYSYEASEIEKIFNAIEKEVTVAKNNFFKKKIKKVFMLSKSSN